DYEGSLENPLTSFRNNWKTTMVDSLRSGQGALPPVQSGSQSPYLSGMFLGPNKTDKPDFMWVKNFAHSKTIGRLRLQKPGETGNVDDTKCRDAPLICYSRGVVSKGDPSSWPDFFCNLSDQLVMELLQSDLTTRQLEEHWPGTFKRGGQPRKERQNMGGPGFITNDNGEVHYAIFKQGYLLGVDVAA
ncbi:MAG: hypothetical protein LQ341_007397, partial [Variospora aurantia]